MKTLWCIYIQLLFHSDQCLLDVDKGFHQYLISPSWQDSVFKDCPEIDATHLKKEKACCCIEIHSLFSSVQCFWILLRALSHYLDTVLFIKVAQNLMHHIWKSKKFLSHLNRKDYFSPISFLDFWDGFCQYLISLVFTEFRL